MMSLLRNPRFLVIAGGVILLVLVITISALSRAGRTTPRPAEMRGEAVEDAARENTAVPTGFRIDNPFDHDPDPATADSDPDVNPQERQKALSQGAFARVGDELLYESDLNFELAYYPAIPEQDPQEIIITKLIEDSVILQGAAADKISTIDATVYNSSAKDYQKRIRLVSEIRDRIEAGSVVLKGTVVAIWFHNMQPGPAGYEGGRKIASNEINRLLGEIRAKRLTIQQAGDAIRSNSGLAQADPNHRGNAIFDFAVTSGNTITYSPDVDREIFKLAPGQVSGVITGKSLDPQTGKQIDAVYMLAEVSERNTSALTNFDLWLEKKKKLYEVIRY